MSPQRPRPPRAAHCEDFDEDANTTLPETRKTANVAKKRSKPDIASGEARQSSTDGASDSGYSSRTAATMGSADSAPGEKNRPAALKVDTSLRESDSRPPVVEHKSDPSGSHYSTSRPALSRSASKTRRSDKIRHAPGLCGQCDIRGYHPATPIDTPRPYEYPTMPPSPQFARHPAPNMMFPHEVHTTQPAASRPSLDRVHSYRQSARPMTFHPGMMEPMYIPVPRPPQGYDFGPPLSASAWTNPHPSYPPPGYAAPPSQPPYIPLPATTMPPRVEYPPPSPYEQPQPIPNARPSDTKTIRRSSIYGPPVVQHRQHPDTIHDAPALERRVSQRDRRPPQPADTHYERDEDFYRMPPPQTIPVRARPPPRKATTTNAAPTVRRPVDMDYSDTRAEVSDRTARRGSRDSASSDQRPTFSRGSENRKSVSYSNAAGSAKIAVGPSLNRRTTLDGHERPVDLEQKQRDIEAYQTAKGTKSTPLTVDALRKARRSQKSSDSASIRSVNSSGKGSDAKTKSGSGAAIRNDNDLTMTINGVKLGFSQDSVEDQRINIRPQAEGGFDLSIGGKNSKKYKVMTREVPSSSSRRAKLESSTRRSRDEHTSSDRASRRSSRSGYSGRGTI